MHIIWSNFAKKMLVNIRSYHQKHTGERIANKLTYEIVREVEILESQPLIGQVESNLIDRTQQFRYLTYKKYKIIYSVSESINQIEIVDVFDTRQNPIKMNRKR